MTIRAALVTLSAGVVLVALVGCTSSTTAAAAPTATHAKASGSASPANPLVGTWQTAAIPYATWEATYRRTGATPAEITQFGVGRGTTARMILRVSGTDWVQFDQWDSQTPGVGSNETYTVSGSTVHLTSADLPVACHQALQLTLSGDILRFRVVSNGADDVPPCSRDDQLKIPVLYETAAFQRIG